MPGSSSEIDVPDMPSGGDTTPSWATGDIWTPGNPNDMTDGQWLIGSGSNYGATAYDPTQSNNLDQVTQDEMKRRGFTGSFYTPAQASGNIASASDNGGHATWTPEFNNFLSSHGINPQSYAQGTGMNTTFTGQDGQQIGSNNHLEQLDGSDFMMAMELGLGGFGAAAGMFGAPGSLGSYAGNTGMSMARTAADGGNLGDVMKSGGIGALGSGLGQLSTAYNPAQTFGVPSDYQGYFNGGLAKAGSSLLTGGNPTQALVGAAAGAAGKYAGDAMSDTTGDYPSIGYTAPDMPTDAQKQSMGDLFSSNPMSLTGQAYQQQKNPNQDPNENPVLAGAKSLALSALGGDSGSSSPIANIGGNLLDMYNRNRQMNGNQRLADNLTSMFGNNSAYANNMRQSLARQYAGSGRNSNIGGREVELQAKLAEMNSRNAPMINTLNNQQGGQRNAMLSDIYRLGAGGPNGGGLATMARNYLQPQQPAPYLNYGNPVSQAPTTSTNEDWAAGD